ncbi:hypothetical protein LCGC14_0789800 [marine sediment metagenome]|uniref:Uncharacterized protein n=1 Tax=marine sediment metagenome TaxID=412755 RepID=A0A0F9PX95_9ZZZZ
MTVYVPHDDGTKDYTDASRFGDLQVIRRGGFIYPDEFETNDMDAQKVRNRNRTGDVGAYETTLNCVSTINPDTDTTHIETVDYKTTHGA